MHKRRSAFKKLAFIGISFEGFYVGKMLVQIEHEAAFSKCILNACNCNRPLCKYLSYESINSDRKVFLQHNREQRRLDKTLEMTVTRDEKHECTHYLQEPEKHILIFWLLCHLWLVLGILKSAILEAPSCILRCLSRLVMGFWTSNF